MTHHLTASALAELEQWETSGRGTVDHLVAAAVEYLSDGASPATVAHTVAHSAVLTDPERVATGFGWAIVALAEQARAAAS